MGEHPLDTFIGFEYPRANYYRLPNDWLEVWAWVRTQLEASDHRSTRMDGFVKWLESWVKLQAESTAVSSTSLYTR